MTPADLDTLAAQLAAMTLDEIERLDDIVLGWIRGAKYVVGESGFDVRLTEDNESFPGALVADFHFDDMAPMFVEYLTAAPALLALAREALESRAVAALGRAVADAPPWDDHPYMEPVQRAPLTDCHLVRFRTIYTGHAVTADEARSLAAALLAKAAEADALDAARASKEQP